MNEENTSPAPSPAFDPQIPIFGPNADMKGQTPLCASGHSLEWMRNYWGKKVNARRDFMRGQMKKEINVYLNVLRHDMSDILPGRGPKNRVDVNVVYPVIQSLVPRLYYRDPKVIVEATKAKFKYMKEAFTDLGDGTPMPDPGFPGGQMIEEVDGPRAAALLAGSVNRNLYAANFKREFKRSLRDSLVCWYGGMKKGWDNEQGFFGMSDETPPPGSNASVVPGMAYGIRVKPWDILVDDASFYNPNWVAFRWAVNPWNLKGDKRLLNTANLKGNSSGAQERFLGSALKREEEATEPLVEHYELYHRPTAEYPYGFFMMITDEVKEDFLYLSDFPTKKTTKLPLTLIYWNEDPDGGLPTPDLRYYIDQQRAKSNLDNTEFEYVKRTLPIVVVDKTNLDDQEKAKIDLQSGRIPRVLLVKSKAGEVVQGVSFNNLNLDFRVFNEKIDGNISRTVGLMGGTGPNNVADVELATLAKEGIQNEQIRTGERADIVRDALSDVVEYWIALYQEYSGEEMSTTVDAPQDMFPGQNMSFPLTFSWREIRGNFLAKIKPFSNNYEDPTILRRQILDRMNLLASPEVADVLKRKGKMYDMERDIKALLETYDDKNADQLLVPYQQTQEEILALQAAAAGAMAPGASPMLPMRPGGGNKEGMPLKGVAVKQEALRQPLNPNAARSSASLVREAENVR
jgi:hypothetical protein